MKYHDIVALSSVYLSTLVQNVADDLSFKNILPAAGYKLVPKTAAQQQKLKALPHDKVTMVQEHGKTYYVFPDAAHNQAYVGGPNQFETYRQLRLKQKEKVEAAEMNLDASTDWGFGASGLGSYSGRVP